MRSHLKRPPKGILTWKNNISSAMDEAGHYKQATALRKCAQTELLLCCYGCGHAKYVVYHCGSRVCPVCSYRLSRERAAYAEAILKKMEYPKFITLTMPRWTRNPRDGIKYLRECFTRLREQKLWKLVRGGCYQIELKRKPDGWHIHLHMLLDAKFIPRQQLFVAWRDILGVGFVSVDVRACRTPQQRAYVTKYVAKASDFAGAPEAVVEWYEATKGSRLFGTLGEWYNAKLEELLDPTEYKPFVPACDCCGAGDKMFFARDGPFVFGKKWADEKCKWVGEQRPEERPIPDEETEFPPPVIAAGLQLEMGV